MTATDVDGPDLADCFMEYELMKQTKSYVERGRDYAPYDDQCVADIWDGSFVQWHRHRSIENSIANDDAAAELRLRGIPEPHERVRSLLDAMRREAERMEQAMGKRPSPSLARRIRAFLAELASAAAGPRN